MEPFDEQNNTAQIVENNADGVLTATMVSDSTRFGCFIYGTVEKGTFAVGDDVVIEHANGKKTQSTIHKIEDHFDRPFEIASEGDRVALILPHLFPVQVQKSAVVRKVVKGILPVMDNNHINPQEDSQISWQDGKKQISKENIESIKCSNCGASAFYDMEQEGFLCGYCGTLIPWDSPVHFNPRPLNIKYYQTDVMTPEIGKEIKIINAVSARMNELPDKSKFRTISINSIIAGSDFEAFQQWRSAEALFFLCKNCGAEINGYSTQTVFECDFCGNKIAEADVIANGNYQKELIVGIDDARKTPRAIPFRVSEEKAKLAISNLIKSYPDCFANDKIIRPLKELMKVYVPAYLAEIALIAKAHTEKGEIRFYQGRQNWTLPATIFFDAYLLNAIQPWDFGKISPFRPAFLEGNVRLFGKTETSEIKEENVNYYDLSFRLPLSDLVPQVKEAFGVNDVDIEWIRKDFHRIKGSTVLLPIYLLDKMPHTVKDKQSVRGDVRFAVNGQTGKVASLHNTTMSNEYILQNEPTRPPKMSEVSTKYSPIIPVISKNKKEEYFIITDVQGAFEVKKKGFFGFKK